MHCTKHRRWFTTIQPIRMATLTNDLLANNTISLDGDNLMQINKAPSPKCSTREKCGISWRTVEKKKNCTSIY